MAVVAEELAALRAEPTSGGPASRLRVALARKVQELSTVRREIATLRRENAALKSQLDVWKRSRAAYGFRPEGCRSGTARRSRRSETGALRDPPRPSRVVCLNMIRRRRFC